MTLKRLNIDIKGKGIVISVTSESSFMPLYSGKDVNEALKVIDEYERSNTKKLEDQIKFINRSSNAARAQILQLVQEDKNETNNQI